jgi:predicted AlkP superfamily phosphohydrolase/phosphomutase
MSPIRKVIAIGLDGLAFQIVEPLLQSGGLPHLARLRALGGYMRLATTLPAQTPVAWSTFATGVNPGGHGIFDFVGRDPRAYRVELALNRYQQTSRLSPPKVVNLRRAAPFWDNLSAAGIPSTVLRCPCTYPPDLARGRQLAGMGVPDLRGGFGTATFFTTAAECLAGESELVQQVVIDGAGAIETTIRGPRQARGDLECRLSIRADRAARRATIQSDGDNAPVTVCEGEWSDWLRLRFKAGLLSSVRGMARFFLSRFEPQFELYASPINFDPAAPLFPISSPPSYAGELADEIGPYYTTGMVEDHNGLSNGRLDEAAFLDQCSQALAERERMMLHELARHDEGLFFILFDTPDRLQHMFWRYREADHPANRGRNCGDYSQAIEEHYMACDAIVGRALAHADDQTLVIVLSDHGFGGFRRGFNINNWLREQGLLTLKRGHAPEEGTADGLDAIDWSQTRAYSIGLSGIYLNMAGREGQGTVMADEAPRLAAEICQRLTGLADPATGEIGVRAAVPRGQAYHGAYVGEAPDVLLKYAGGYRSSWATALGGLGDAVWEDNTKLWSGDHIVDPELVPGVLFMNRPFDTAAASMIDMAPTILAALGLSKTAAMEGRSLLR